MPRTTAKAPNRTTGIPPVTPLAAPTAGPNVPPKPMPSPGTEWLLTDGRGGFAMGTVSGVPTRRYHALFIAATTPPVGRIAMLNATVDRLVVDPGLPGEGAFELSSFRFVGTGERVHPDGASRITGFRSELEAEWVFQTPVARVVRTLRLGGMDGGADAAVLRYTVERSEENGKKNPGSAPIRLTVRPLVSMRDFHGLIRRHWADHFDIAAAPEGRGCSVRRDGRTLHLRGEPGMGCAFVEDRQWWHDFHYTEDAQRGQDCVEDLFSPGEFSVDVAPGQRRAEFTLVASTGPRAAEGVWPGAIATRVAERAARRLAAADRVSAAARTLAPELRGAAALLASAADDFIVERRAATQGSERGVSVIAGYPWFSDWGRDTFISLPGLMLVTGRWDDARRTLLAFAGHRRRGLIPNVFDDRTGEAEFNTADASLWFVQAACAYAETTGDLATWRDHLAPACLDVVAHHRRGTDFNIAMDPFDKLLTAGTAATQLTWMDARRDGVVFTPRHGKPVEINALWVSGLRRIAGLLAPTDPQQAANLNDLADAASRSFAKAFWNADGNCLFDVLTPSEVGDARVSWSADASIRPNQIFAVSLPHSPLSREQQAAVVACVHPRLWTPMGLRTLDPADSRYRGRYQGNLFDRDGAYHQGTVWPWLLGPLAEAMLRAGAFSDASRRAAADALTPILRALSGGSGGAAPAERPGAIGQIAEVFDGDEPRRAQGCPAQAWSIAELLRAIVLLGG